MTYYHNRRIDSLLEYDIEGNRDRETKCVVMIFGVGFSERWITDRCEIDPSAHRSSQLTYNYSFVPSPTTALRTVVRANRAASSHGDETHTH